MTHKSWKVSTVLMPKSIEKQTSKSFLSSEGLKLLSYVLKITILSLIYFYAAKFGLQFDAVSGFATLVWPPTGIALAALLIFGWQLFPAIFIGAFLVNLATGAPFFSALGIGLGNTLEAFVAAYILRRYAKFNNSLETLRDVFSFFAWGVLLGTLLSATIGTFSLLFGGVVNTETLRETWTAWWVGDMLGALIVAPVLLTLGNLKIFDFLAWKRIPELICLSISVLIINIIVFFNATGLEKAAFSSAPLLYLVFPTPIWAALRFGPGGAAMASFATSIIAIWATTLGLGPFAGDVLSNNLLFLQIFIGTTSVTFLILAATMTERLRAEKELIREKNKDEAILANIGDGLIATDSDGKIMLVNRAAEDMLLWNKDDMIGKKLNDVIPIKDDSDISVPKDKRPITVALKTGITTTTTASKPYYYVRNDKTKFAAAITVTPLILDGEIAGAIEVFRDTTVEREIDKAKSEFVSLASHQLRTPIATIKWYAGALLEGERGDLHEEQKRYVQEIYDNSNRMAELTNALLNVSRLELGTFSIEPRPTDICKTADSVLKEFSSKMGAKRIRLEKNYDTNLPLIDMDDRLLRMIFQNLTSNAIKYSPENKLIKLTITLKTGEILIDFCDEGCGIPQEDRKKIFTKLFRAGNAKAIDPEGSGLGLYIVKLITDRSGGKIWFESETGSGTTFHVTLPLSGMKKSENVKKPA